MGLIRLFLKKLILLLIKNALNWSKVTVKSLKMSLKISNKCCSFEFSIHPGEKKWPVSAQILSSTAVFNTGNNKKYFLSSKSAYYNDFWRIMWHYWSNNNVINVTE